MPAKPTILLVEPARERREIMRQILERQGYQVVAVASPNGAVPAVALTCPAFFGPVET